MTLTWNRLRPICYVLSPSPLSNLNLTSTIQNCLACAVVEVLKFTHTTPFSDLFTGSKPMNESSIRFFLLHYKVFTTAQPGYLRIIWSLLSRLLLKLILSSVTLSRPSSSSLKITDHSFRYATPCFGINFLPHSVNLILIILFLANLNPIV